MSIYTQTYRKKPLYKRKRLMGKALAMAKSNRRKINMQMEEKHWPLNTQAITTATIGAVYPLSRIAVGDTDTARDGNKITAKRLRVRIHSIGDILSRFVRFIIFVDHQQHGADPTVTDVLINPLYNSNLEIHNKGRFRILMDRTMRLSGVATDYDSYKQMVYDRRLSFPISYISDAGDEPSQGKNCVFLLVISQTIGTANKITYDSLLDYVD